MRRVSIALALLLLTPGVSRAQSRVLHVAVLGESNLKSNFLESLRDAAKDNGFTVDIQPRSEAEYVLLVAQESTIGTAAAAVIALDRDGEIVASVVRSGRLSGRGAFNACAKELIKKFAVLRPRG